MEEKMRNPPPYSQQQPADPVIVVTGAVQTTPVGITNVVVGPPVGPKPCALTCRSCGAEVITRVEYQATMKTHLIALLLCVLGCWCCCCIPYCVDSCRNADHYCPNCNSYIGAYNSQ